MMFIEDIPVVCNPNVPCDHKWEDFTCNTRAAWMLKTEFKRDIDVINEIGKQCPACKDCTLIQYDVATIHRSTNTTPRYDKAPGVHQNK